MASVKLLRFSASHQSFQIESTLLKIHHVVQDCVHVCRGTFFFENYLVKYVHMYYWCVVANGKVVVMVMWYSKVMVLHEKWE